MGRNRTRKVRRGGAWFRRSSKNRAADPLPEPSAPPPPSTNPFDPSNPEELPPPQLYRAPGQNPNWVPPQNPNWVAPGQNPNYVPPPYEDVGQNLNYIPASASPAAVPPPKPPKRNKSMLSMPSWLTSNKVPPAPVPAVQEFNDDHVPEWAREPVPAVPAANAINKTNNRNAYDPATDLDAEGDPQQTRKGSWTDMAVDAAGDYVGRKVGEGIKATRRAVKEAAQKATNYMHEANRKMDQPEFFDELGKFSQKAAIATNLFLDTMDEPLNRALDKADKIVERTAANAAKSATRATMAAAEEIFPIGPIIAVGNIITNMSRAAENVTQGIRDSSRTATQFFTDVDQKMKEAQQIALRTNSSINDFTNMPQAVPVVQGTVIPTVQGTVIPEKKRGWFRSPFSSSNKTQKNRPPQLPDVVQVPEEQPRRWFSSKNKTVKNVPPPQPQPQKRGWFSSSSSGNQTQKYRPPPDVVMVPEEQPTRWFSSSSKNKTMKNVSPPTPAQRVQARPVRPPDVVMVPEEQPARWFSKSPPTAMPAPVSTNPFDEPAAQPQRRRWF